MIEFSQIGQPVVWFDVEKAAILKRWRFVRSGRVRRLRITGRCRRASGDGGRVTAGGCRRDWNTGGRRRDTSRIGLPSNVFRVWKFVVFLPFHTTILKPDFDLTLGQT